jgi:hypothetical protein
MDIYLRFQRTLPALDHFYTIRATAAVRRR